MGYLNTKYFNKNSSLLLSSHFRNHDTRSISYDDANTKIFFKNINIGNDDDSSEGPLSSLLFVWENVS